MSVKVTWITEGQSGIKFKDGTVASVPLHATIYRNSSTDLKCGIVYKGHRALYYPVLIPPQSVLVITLGGWHFGEYSIATVEEILINQTFNKLEQV